jgi:FkbM family methyltransferase
MGRKIFLDCGGNSGMSVDLFRAVYPHGRDYIIHSFEPNPQFAKAYASRHVHFHPCAVWEYTGRVKFYLSRGTQAAGSSLFKHKTTGKLDKKPISVRCINLATWMQKNLTPDDHIVLKLDIEGAEYAVLMTLLHAGVLSWVKELFIEWHWERVKIPREVHDRIYAQVCAAGLQPKEWRGDEGWFEGMLTAPERQRLERA